MGKILLIDGENILHQSFHKFEKLKSTDGRPSGAIFGFFKSLHMYLNRFDPDDVIITFDNGHSKVRTDILPNYKGHRKNISIDYESLQSQKRQILKILGMLRIKYVFDKNKTTVYEGDDFLAYFVLHNKEDKITIISSDKDFNQLLEGRRVKIFNPRKEAIVTVDNCKELFGYEANETVDYLSLVGDTSDDIPGYPGIGPVKARKFLDKYGSIQKALQGDEKDNEKLQETFSRNTKLIDLRWFIAHYNLCLGAIPIKNYKKKTINIDKFKKICIEYSLSSFMTNEFMKPFNKLLS